MNVPDIAKLRPTTSDPALRDALVELVGLGLRIARVTAELAETERQVVAVVAGGMPESLAEPGSSFAEAHGMGLAVDGTDDALAHASPRVAAMTQAFDRVSRAVRRTVALVERIDAGWPRRGGSDDRRAMARRQVARAVGERIARHADGEAAERLFDDLHERLDEWELDGRLDQPVDVVIAAICRDLKLAAPVTAGIAEPAAVARKPDG